MALGQRGPNGWRNQAESDALTWAIRSSFAFTLARKRLLELRNLGLAIIQNSQHGPHSPLDATESEVCA